MPSYKTLIVLALVASNVFVALSAPIPQVRKQSLSHRGNSIAPVVGKRIGPKFKKYGKEFGIGMAATMAFSYLFEKLGASSASKETSTVATSATSGSPKIANTANYANSQAYPSYSTSTGPSSSTPSYMTPTGPTAQTQNGYQQRDVDRGPKNRALVARKVAWGKLLKTVAIDLGIGTASTVAGYAALDAITGPPKAAAPEAAAAPSTNPAAPPTDSVAPPPAPPPTNSPAPPTKNPPAPSTNSGPPPKNSGSPPATDLSNTNSDPSQDPSSSPDSIFARSVSNKNRRATSALELFSRSDLDVALKLFKRVLDELD